MMNPHKAELIEEALRSALAEIEAMEGTYDDYVASGKLIEQLEEAIALIEEEGCQ